jgi:hypothetical protein
MNISRLAVLSLLLLALWINGQRQIAIAATALAPNVVNQPAAPSSRHAYEGYYLYLGDHPTEENPGWDENAQGLAHDQDHWFITQKCCLWRIPVIQDLSTAEATSAGVSKVGISQVLPTFNHFGDLTYYAFEGRGFLIVPLENHDTGQCGAIGIFDADTLGLIASQCLPGQGFVSGWVAVDPTGILYSAGSETGRVTSIRRYAVDWPNLKANNKLSIAAAGDMEIFDESGAPLTLNGLQGGEVSPSGELLYLMADGGLHVFDMATQRRIQRSTNGYGYFNYEYHPDTGGEPEGITIWDLDDGRAPGIRGQLHAIMLDNNDWPFSDDVYIKHYTNKIAVDAARNETISNAINFAWDGAIITVQPGNYPEAITLAKRVRLVAPAGSVQIGQ